MELFEKYLYFFGPKFSLGYSIVIALFFVWIWSIVIISYLIKNVFKLIKSLRIDIKENEVELKRIGEGNYKEKEEKKKEYDKAINRILESENLMFIVRYLTIVISGLLLVLVVVIIGLVIILK